MQLCLNCAGNEPSKYCTFCLIQVISIQVASYVHGRIQVSMSRVQYDCRILNKEAKELSQLCYNPHPLFEVSEEDRDQGYTDSFLESYFQCRERLLEDYFSDMAQAGLYVRPNFSSFQEEEFLNYVV